jgi:NAD(P)H-flavin reductase/formate hydrogenlyase subunit 6/NADH:ubiquinone oxidoreductase subunit I
VTDAPAVAGVLARPDLDRLIEVLRNEGRRVIGPTVRDGAVVHDEVGTAAELPWGARSVQGPGSYRLAAGDPGRAFDYGPAATSWKPFVFPPVVAQTVASVEPDGEVRYATVEPGPTPRLAFLGVRPCELAALHILGTAVSAPPAPDEDSARRRAAALTVVAECAAAGGTCFCAAMGTGPGVDTGFDLALLELADGFLVRVGSAAGAAVAAELPLQPASRGMLAERDRVLAATQEAMGSPVDVDGLPERLRAAAASPRWAEVAERCLACANCTLVCPTCFCTGTTQQSDLDATHVTAERHWDSCFTGGFAAVAGGSFRPRVQDRYRQWLTHKFGTWPEQFGTFGCVGCGRCVTWCPVRIDVRAELQAIAPAEATSPRPAPPVVVATPTGPAPELLALTWPYAAAQVVWAAPETPDVTTLRLATDDPAIRAGRPGQFVMAALPGFPPSAISISRYHPDGLELTVRAAGPATAALGRLRPGTSLGLRGPLGRPWPMADAVGRDVLVVAGGIGLAPLRPVIDAVQSDPGGYGRMHICYGAKTPADRLYVGETMRLRRCRCADVAETVDRADDGWTGQVGLVTCLLDEEAWDVDRMVAFVCGPERMMQVVAATLLDRGMSAERIWLTFERHMECGVGQCGHCQMGPFFVCRDGPVFSLAEVRGVFGVEGI